MQYPLDPEDHKGRAVFAVEVAAARLAFTLGTPWHRVGDKPCLHDTRYGPAVYSKATLRKRVTEMASISLPPDFMEEAFSRTCSALSIIESDAVPSVKDERHLADLSAGWRSVSNGVLSMETAKEAGKRLRGMFRRRTWSDAEMTNAAWETLFSLHTALSASVPGRYAQFVLESSFASSFPRAVTRETAVALALDGEKARDFARAAERLLRR